MFKLIEIIIYNALLLKLICLYTNKNNVTLKKFKLLIHNQKKKQVNSYSQYIKKCHLF